METSVFRYSNGGASLGMLKYDDAVHEEDLDGTDKLVVVCEANLNKRDKLVWRDSAGTWHEHMVDSIRRTHAGRKPRSEATCSNSISELFGVQASGTVSTRSVQSHLAALLSGTRWTAGSCSNFGNVKLETWHKSVRQCLSELCDACGGELETVVTVGGNGVTKRTVRIVKQRGSSQVTRQFTYGRNVSSIMREVGADEVYTKVVGYGAKIDSDAESEYAARLTVEATSSLNLSTWGVADSNGNMQHNVTTYTDNACTSQSFLLAQCRKMLDVYSKPLIRYEFDVAEMDDSLWGDVQLGNLVSCVDETFDPALELMERVSHVSRRLKGRMSCKVAIGERPNPLVEQFKATEKQAKQSTGNSTRTSNYTPVNTSGGSSYSGGYSGGTSGGDSIIHQLDGVTITGGVINFSTVATEVQGQPTESESARYESWSSEDAWGGGGNGNFSSSGGGKF